MSVSTVPYGAAPGPAPRPADGSPSNAAWARICSRNARFRSKFGVLVGTFTAKVTEETRRTATSGIRVNKLLKFIRRSFPISGTKPALCADDAQVFLSGSFHPRLGSSRRLTNSLGESHFDAKAMSLRAV